MIPQLVEEIAAPYGARGEVDYQRGVPPAVNDPEATEAFRAAATALLGPGAVQETPQSMGAEDFAWFLDRVPGVMARLGVRRPGTLDAPDLHCGDFDVDEAAIGCGAGVLVAAAMERARRPEAAGATSTDRPPRRRLVEELGTPSCFRVGARGDYEEGAAGVLDVFVQRVVGAQFLLEGDEIVEGFS